MTFTLNHYSLLARTSNSQLLTADPNASAYYFSDAQGNVVAMVNWYGMMMAQYKYDPFGNMISMSGPLASANRYRFSSKEWNDGPNIYYYGYRFYDPNLQRWLNRDPIEEDGGVNLYGFVFNAAVNLVDPFGFGCNGDSSPTLPNGLQYMMPPPSSLPTTSPPTIHPSDPSGTQLQNFAKTAAQGAYNNTDLKNIVNQDVQNALNSIPGLGWLGDLLGGSGSGLSNPFAGSKTDSTGDSVNYSIKPWGYPFGQSATASASYSCPNPFAKSGKFTAKIEASIKPPGAFNFHRPSVQIRAGVTITFP